MSAEPIDIVVQDKVSSGVQNKFLNIASAALNAADNVDKLIASLGKVNVGALTKAAQAQATATQNLQIAAQKLAQSQTATATAQQKLQTATTATATAQQKLAAATAQATAASTRAATATTQQATAQQRLAAASTQAALAALRLQQAQDRAAKGAAGYSGELSGLLARLGAIGGGALGVKGLIDLGDAYTTLQNKLQTVATSQAQVVELTERLFDVANRTRSPVEDTTTAFTRFDRALQQLGKSQEDTLRLTETVNKALVVGGASSSERASALLQLSQAFNAGKLQGDEFRAVAENIPSVLDAIAKATNTPINQVKKLSTEGKITSEVLYKAFQILGTTVDEKFAKTIPTVADAMTILKNRTLEAFGEFNKAYGITENLAKGIIFLSNHLEILRIATIGVGAALAAAFAPSVIARILAVNAAILANPIGLIIGAIVAATAALVIFSDKINVTSDGAVKLIDVFKALFGFVSEGASTVGSIISSAFGSAIDYLNEKVSGAGDTFKDLPSLIGQVAKQSVNLLIANFTFGLDALSIIWKKLPGLVEYATKSAVNFAIDGVESIVNAWVSGLSEIAKLLANFAPAVSKSITDSLDNVKVTLPKLDISKDADDAATDLSKAFQSAFSKDYLGSAANAVMNRARSIAASRDKATLLTGSGYGGAGLRGTGPNTTVVDDPAADKRAKILEKINGELDKQIRYYGQLQAVREVQEKLDEYDIQLAAKKLPKLSTNERADLQVKLETIEANKRIQKEQDAIYDGATGPARQFSDQLRAINNLTKIQALNTTEVAEATRKAEYAFAQATNPLFEFNRSIEDQNKLLGLNSREREQQAAVQQIANQLAPQGKQLTEEQTASIIAQTKALQDRKDVQSALDQIESQTIGSQRQLVAQQEALKQALERGHISLENYQVGLTQVKVAMADLNLSRGIGDFEDAVVSSLGRILDGFKNVATGATNAFGAFFESVTDGAANSLGRAIVYGESLGDALRDVAKSALSELLSALIKVGIQWAINQALGVQSTSTAVGGVAAETAAYVAGQTAKTAAALASIETITLANTFAAAETALAWAPAAAAASLASFGANALPASAGIAETYALTEALSALAGFEQGGYTGDIGRQTVAGVVHGEEFVVNAEGTRRNRGALEQMNRGATVGTSGDGGVKIKVENYGTPQAYEYAGMSEGEMRLIARDVVNKEAPAAVARDMDNPNSVTSKSQLRNWKSTRNRF